MELEKLAEIHFDTNDGYLTMVDPLHFSTIDTDAILADPSLCDKMIAKHVAGCRQIAFNQQCVSIVSDKVRGVSMPSYPSPTTRPCPRRRCWDSGSSCLGPVV